MLGWARRKRKRVRAQTTPPIAPQSASSFPPPADASEARNRVLNDTDGQWAMQGTDWLGRIILIFACLNLLFGACFLFVIAPAAFFSGRPGTVHFALTGLVLFLQGGVLYVFRMWFLGMSRLIARNALALEALERRSAEQSN